jgi:hypothetical protein
MSDIIDHGDHQHTALELRLATENGALREALKTVTASERLLRRALLQLMPQPGEKVTLTLSENDGLINDDGSAITALTFFHDATGILDIRVGE